MEFIAGAGSTNIDLLYQGMSKIPDIGEEVYSKDFSLQLGGGVPATLINVSRLGIKTKLATELGSDIFSLFAKGEYEKRGISPVNLYNSDDMPVNITSAVILKNDRSFISYGKGSITPDDKAKEAFYNMAKGSKITLMQFGGFTEVYKKLKEEGTILVFDTGWDDEMSLEKYGDYLSLADYYTPNKKEALKITGAKTAEEAAKSLEKYFSKVVIKLDKEGCLGVDEGKLIYVKSLNEFKAVDSTGAGDAFLAGFIYGLFYNYSLKDCIEFGNITGGKAVTKAGALSAYLNEKELLEYKRNIK